MAISKVIYKSSANATPETWMDATTATATAVDITSPKTAMLANGVVTSGSIPSKTSSDLTANNLTVTAPSGYYASAASKTLSDQNLVAGNIKKDVPIFGVLGTLAGGVTLTTSTIATIATEVTIKAFLDNNPLPLKYVSGMVFLFFDSDTAPTQGSRTWTWSCYVYRNSTSKQYMMYAYSNSLVAPNSINPVPGGANDSYFGISNGAINGSGGHTNFYLPVGTKVIRADVPLDMYGKAFNTTEV